MNLRERLANELKVALRAGDKKRLGVVRMLLSELKVAQASGKQFDELAVVKGYGKKLRKSAEQYRELNLPQKAQELLDELAVVEQFLPKQMERAEIERLVTELVETSDYGPGDLGRVMKALMSEHAERLDGRLAQQIARQKLADRA